MDGWLLDGWLLDGWLLIKGWDVLLMVVVFKGRGEVVVAMVEEKTLAIGGMIVEGGAEVEVAEGSDKLVVVDWDVVVEGENELCVGPSVFVCMSFDFLLCELICF